MRSVRAILWRVCRNQDVRALLDRGAVKYIAWGNTTLWRDVMDAEVQAHDDDWSMPATVKPGEGPLPLEAYRTEGYRGSSEIRVRTQPLIDSESHLVVACRNNQAALDPDAGGDPTRLVALLVVDSEGEAHLRGSLRDELPQLLRDAIDEKATDGRPFGAVYLDEREMDIARTLVRDHNVLLVGPPGTGKTRMMTRLRHAFEDGVASLGFDPAASTELFATVDDPVAIFGPLPDERVTRFVTFHPSLTYDDFMIGIRPRVSDAGELVFETVSGNFLELAARVLSPHDESGSDDASPSTAGLLLIDEFNRGNVPEIFGEVITLLESDKRLAHDGSVRPTTVAVRLSMVPADVGLDQELRLPHHLYLLASMNSVDRSVAPIDSALRRRFRVIDVRPDVDVARRVLLAGGTETPGITDLSAPTDEEARSLAVRVLAAVNERIGSDWGWEFELGHSYILAVTDIESLIAAWNETIRPHLNTIYRDGAELLDEWLLERDVAELADGRAFDSMVSGEGAIFLRRLSPTPHDLALLHRVAWGQPPSENDARNDASGAADDETEQEQA